MYSVHVLKSFQLKQISHFIIRFKNKIYSFSIRCSVQETPDLLAVDNTLSESPFMSDHRTGNGMLTCIGRAQGRHFS